MKIKTETHTENQNDVVARLQSLKKEAAELEKQLARGTGDVSEQARTARRPRVGGDMSASLSERIEAALRTKPHSLDELARELKESAGKIAAAVKPMRNRLFNAGTETDPAWFWIVGDHASATEINNAVRALVHYRPMSFTELRAATGARQGRVSGAIVAMQRDPKSRISNIDDNPLRARWFVVPEGVAISRLKPR